MDSTNQNVGFVGFISRKDKDTGVNLLAKIVTPSKRRSLNKLVRVKVKANALDDYSCCVIDHATMKKIIEDSQDLESVNESFQFLYNGEHGTSISYAIEKLDSSSNINQYLSDDGTLFGRPKYNPDGTTDAVGYIRITVTKNDAEVSSRIMVKIKGMTADEVINSDKVYSAYKNSLAEYLWDGIAIYDGSNNDVYRNEGYTHIVSPLHFNNMSEINVNELSEVPIKCKWVIKKDEVADYINGAAGKFSNVSLYDLEGGGHSRICMDSTSADYGKIYQPTYKETCENLIANRFAERLTVGENIAKNRRFYIGKTDPNASGGRLYLYAILSLGDAKPIEKEFMCGTTSQPMRTEEVCEFYRKIMKIKLNDVFYTFDDSVTPIEIIVPDMATNSSAAKKQTISVFGDGHISNLAQEQYDTLMLSKNTLNNIGTMGETEPYIYEVPTDGSGNYTTFYPFTTLFETSAFIRKDGTDLLGNTVVDDTRDIVIPVGTSGTGMYKASSIIDSPTGAKDSQFAIRFRLNVRSLADGDSDTNLTFTKVFRLVRGA